MTCHGHTEFISQVAQIYNYSQTYLSHLVYDEDYDMKTMNTGEFKSFPKQVKNILKSDRKKLSDEDKAKIRQIRETMRNKQLIQHLFDEEYKMNRAKELAEKYVKKIIN